MKHKVFRPVVMPLVLVWFQLLNQLRSDWEINPQYAFGFIVPPLALALFWRRWVTRPAPAPPQGNGMLWLAGAELLLLLPIRLIEEANPEWRLLLWVHGLLVIGFTFTLVQFGGGAGWRRHFAFPLCFVLVSIPWPVFFEQAVIQGLMRGVAGLTVEVVGFLGIPALQRGNLIEISTGLVGVDEACSGVRSLQTTLMIALFLGELYWFSVRRRLVLVGAAMLLALPANVGRTVFLVWVTARHGFEALHRAHDGAGMLVIAVVIPVLWGAALWLRRGWNPVFQMAPAGTSAARSLSWNMALALLSLAAAAELGTEAWYRGHETGVVPNARWTVAWPTNQMAFGEVEIGDTARATLRCDAGRGVSWTDARANQWRMFFLRWEPGKNSTQLAKGHTPDICLPGAGHQLLAEHAPIHVPVRGLNLAFRRYEFNSGGRALFVYYCLWEDRSPKLPSDAAEDGTQGSRLQAVWSGRRHLGQQVLEMAVDGPSTPMEAVLVLKEQLEHVIVR